MKNAMIVFLGCALFGVFPAVGQIKSGEEIIIREPVADDLYIAGGTVTIDAPIEGDLIVTGGTININDSVKADLLAAGGKILVNGHVGDDIRCAGGTVKITAGARGDLIVTGGTIQVGRGAVIGGDVLASGGEVVIDGVITGSLKDASGEFTLNGEVGGDLSAKGGRVLLNGVVGGASVLAARDIELGAKAVFRDDVRYWNKQEALDFGSSMHGGNATLDSSLRMEEGKWHYLGFASFLMVLWYLGTALVMIVVLEYLFAFTFSGAANTVRNASLKSLGFGFLFLVGMPVVILVSFITIVGLPLGILLLLSFVVIIVLGTVIVSLIGANWINNTFYQSSWGMGRIIIAAFVIFIFLKLASLTPVVGPLIMLLLAGMAFGGILLNIRWKRNKRLALT